MRDWPDLDSNQLCHAKALLPLAGVIVRLYSIWAKVAVTVLASSIVIAQALVPVHARLHPLKTLSVPGVAVICTCVFSVGVCRVWVATVDDVIRDAIRHTRHRTAAIDCLAHCQGIGVYLSNNNFHI